MEKFTKLLLLTLCFLFLFLLFSNAQNLQENNLFTDEENVNSIETWWSTVWTRANQYNYLDTGKCTANCGINLLWLFFIWIQILIWIILWMLLIASTVNTVTLHKRFNNNKKYNCLTYIPILNLYHISKITIWRLRFFCLMLLIWFFGYSIYKNINENRCCYDKPSQYVYIWTVLWILAIVILRILLLKLNSYFKEHSNKIN